MAQRILVILGHPAVDSLCGALAAAYVQGAREEGAEIRTLHVGELSFDPLLHAGYREVQPLEPDLQTAQSHIQWADHLVWVYPIWWGAMPALLKGFIDRIFLPGFSHKYRTDSPMWDRLLSGRSAELLVTMDSPPWYFRLMTRMPGHHQMKKAILEFAGVRPVRVRSIGPVRSSAAKRAGWVTAAKQWGAQAVSR